MEREVELEVGSILAAGWEQLRENHLAAAIALAVLVGGNLALDAVGAKEYFVSGFLSLGANYYVTRAALNRAGLLPHGFDGRFASFWGMTIISGLAIILGTIALLVPGLYLASRWFLAGPAIVAGDLTAREGMSESWHLTAPFAWHICGALVLVWAVGFGLGLAPSFIYGENGVPTVLQALSYVAMFSGIVLTWFMAVAVYAATLQSTHRLEEVFA